MIDFFHWLIIGGAQLGMRYGITNGKFLPTRDFYTILKKAPKMGFRYFDLARSYGAVEARFAMYAAQFQSGSIQKLNRSNTFCIGSKIHIPRGNSPEQSYIYFRKEALQLQKTYQKNPLAKLNYILLHNFTADQKHYLSTFSHLSQKGIPIGISIYKIEELEFLLSLETPLPIQIIQLPYNLIDRRFVKYFGILRNQGITIQLRSLYLQGLLLLPKEVFLQKHMQYFSILYPIIAKLDQLQTQYNRNSKNPVAMCRQDLLLLLGFAQSVKIPTDLNNAKIVAEDYFSPLILGISSPAELLALAHSVKRIQEISPESFHSLAIQLEALLADCIIPISVLLPTLWPKKSF